MASSIINFLTRTPPQCLSGLKPEPVSVTSEEVVWKLKCVCGSDFGAVLGYPLSELKPGIESSDIDMVSPFRFRCGKCQREVEFLDTRVHSEGAELGKEEGFENGCAAYTGEGEPTLVACSKCGQHVLRSIATMYYHDERVDDWEEDNSFRLPDYFCGFRLSSTCRDCNLRMEVANIDTKF